MLYFDQLKSAKHFTIKLPALPCRAHNLNKLITEEEQGEKKKEMEIQEQKMVWDMLTSCVCLTPVPLGLCI